VPPPGDDGTVEEATRRELLAAGRLHTPAGRAALAAAAVMDSSDELSNDELVAAAQEHMAALADAMGSPPTAGDELQKVRARRAARGL